MDYIVYRVAFHFIFMVYFIFLSNFLHFVLWYELDDSKSWSKFAPKAHGNQSNRTQDHAHGL